MKKKLLALLFGTSLILAACGGGGDDATDTSSGGDTAAGEKIAKQTCAACHGGDLTGAIGPDLTKVGSKYSEDEIKNIIKKGRGDMPPQSLSDEDINAVASWLSSQK